MAILDFGSTAAQIKNTPRWVSTSGPELDSLFVDYTGSVSAMNAFLNSRQRWEPSSIDGNMLLSEWPNDADPHHPTVTLRYVGLKGGQTKTPLIDDVSSEQSIRYATVDGSLWLDLRYISPGAQARLISTQRLTAEVGGITVTQITPNHVVWWTTNISGITSAAAALVFFVQRTLFLPENTELVPGRYYRSTITKQVELFSVGA